MQQPPPYYEMPGGKPRRNTNRTLWLIAGIVLIPCCGCVIFMAYYGLKVGREMMPHIACFGKADVLNDAIQQYAKDHDGKLPSAEKWQEELEPYANKGVAGSELINEAGDSLKTPFRCLDPRANAQTRFVLNRDVSGKVLKDLDPNTIILFETPGGEGELVADYTVRPHGSSPFMIFYERRGWIEFAAIGRPYLLIEDEGRLQRVPLPIGADETVNEGDIITVDDEGNVVGGAAKPAEEDPGAANGTQSGGSASGSE